MSQPYQHITWGELKAALALTLSDTTNVYWEDSELGLYLAESLRVWGLLTGFWRDTGVLTTSANTPFYDLTTLTNSDGDTLLDYTVTDQDLVTMIQYHFLEPPTGNSWTGSEQFTLDDITKALQRRRDLLIADTGCVVTRNSGIPLTPTDTKKFLSDNIVAIRRLAFIGADGILHPLVPTDVMSQRNYDASMFTPGVPYSYSSVSTRPTEILLAPPSNQPGTLDSVVVQTGAALNPVTGVLLGLPDDYSWAVKWGAMADLLAKDGPARDSIRSSYCERRYALALELINVSPVVVNAEINGVSLDTDSLTNMDFFNSTWQTATGVPDSIASIRTLAALSPCPDAVYSITFDVVRKAPIPTTDGEYVQIGREQLDAILDYAQHLAAFKMGGEEFRSSFKGAENFFIAAIAYNERLSSMSPNILNLMRQSTADRDDKPYEVAGGLGALQGQPLSGGSATLDKSPGQDQPASTMLGT